MSRLPRFPLVYEINTWPWLDKLSQQAGYPITLANVPQEELTRLTGLHLDAVWLMGVWQRSPGSQKISREHPGLQSGYEAALPGYNQEDIVGSPFAIYQYRVNPAFGGDDQLAVFRARLNELGLKLILDFVPNHLALDNLWLKKYPERFVQGSPELLKAHPDRFFTDPKYPDQIWAHAFDPFYGGWEDTIQVDFRSLKTRQAMARTLMDIAGLCDGVRCDMAMLLVREKFLELWGGEFDPPDAEFWEETIPRVKEKYPNFLFLAEVYWLGMDYILQQQGFDYTYDKTLYDHLRSNRIHELQAHLQTSPDFQYRMARFIENHDEERAMTTFGPERGRAAAVLALMLPGLRLLHEDQMAGSRIKIPVQLKRRPTEKSDAGLEAFYQLLLRTLHQSIFHEGSWKMLEPQEAWPGNETYHNFIAFRYVLEDKYWIVIVNYSDHRSQCRLFLDKTNLAGLSWRLYDVFDEKGYSQSGDKLVNEGLFIDRPAYGIHLAELQNVSFDLPQDPTHLGIHLQSTTEPVDKGIYSLVWKPQDQVLAFAGQDKEIRLWDTIETRLLKKLSTQQEVITSLAWSPDSRMIASGSNDHSIFLWDLESGRQLLRLRSHENSVLSLAWSPDGEQIGSGSHDRTVRLWNVHNGECQVLLGHTDSVNCVAWSPDGKTLASGSGDQTIRLWNMTSRQTPLVLNGHDWVSSLAWSPDSRYLAAGTGGATVDLWDTVMGKKVAVCEGHTRRILGVAFNNDGNLLASKSNDGTVRLWEASNWTCLIAFEEPGEYLGGIAFHPKLPLLATRDDKHNSFHIWEIDAASLQGILQTASTVYYKNAKAVLVGDTGVGKTGLWLVLTGQPYQAADSTHGRQVGIFDYQEVDQGENSKETRETLLWDLAGQPGYRLIHQLHLDEISVALVVFDSRSETDLFAGVDYWNRALDQAIHLQGSQAPPLKKFLVAARTDRTGIAASNERIEQICHESGFERYFPTSAKENWQIPELRKAIRDAIDWKALVRVSTNELFQRIKEFLLQAKNRGLVLTTSDNLYQMLLAIEASRGDGHALEDSPGLCDQFEVCIGLVQSRGLIQRLSFGDLVLLQPELLDSYASALVDAARQEPDGTGTISLGEAMTGNFLVPEEVRIKKHDQEKLLLVAVVEDLLRYEIALSEQTDQGTFLVFPSQVTRLNPGASDPEARSIVFTFEGPLRNIYATLVVRLSHSGLFQTVDMWQNASKYQAKIGGTCELYLNPLQDGRGELILAFDATATEETQFQFEEYVHAHLKRRAIPESLYRRRYFICPSCATLITDQAVVARRKRGFDWIECNVCQTIISLMDREERLSKVFAPSVSEMDLAADRQRERAVARAIIEGKRTTGDFDVFLCHNAEDKADIKAVAGQLLERAILPWLDEWELRPGQPWLGELEKQLSRVKAAAVFVGASGIAPWQRQEIAALLQEFGRRNCPVIPVLLPNFPHEQSELPQFLKNMVWVDFRKVEPVPMQQLIWGITGTRNVSR
jgi:WD40 repeat protein